MGLEFTQLCLGHLTLNKHNLTTPQASKGTFVNHLICFSKNKHYFCWSLEWQTQTRVQTSLYSSNKNVLREFCCYFFPMCSILEADIYLWLNRWQHEIQLQQTVSVITPVCFQRKVFVNCFFIFLFPKTYVCNWHLPAEMTGDRRRTLCVWVSHQGKEYPHLWRVWWCFVFFNEE